MAPEKNIGVIVKSNAYGHGLVQVAQIADKLGAPYLIVDSVYEALILKDARVKTPIMVLGFTATENLKKKKYPFTFVVADKESLKVMVNFQTHAPIHVFINTGMNREGFDLSEIDWLIDFIKTHPKNNFEGVMSHFAEADVEPTTNLTEKQNKNFDFVLERFSDAGINFKFKHIDATTAVMHQHKTSSNFVRLGRAFYGIGTENKLYEQLKPAMEFLSTIVNIRNVKKGDVVGYGATFVVEQDMKVALIPAGYQEGVERRLSNKGMMTVRNVHCPIVGRVSMNYSIIDVSKVEGVGVGDEVIIYSKNPKDPNSLNNVSLICETIGHEMMVRVDHSVRREII